MQNNLFKTTFFKTAYSKKLILWKNSLLRFLFKNNLFYAKHLILKNCLFKTAYFMKTTYSKNLIYAKQLIFKSNLFYENNLFLKNSIFTRKWITHTPPTINSRKRNIWTTTYKTMPFSCVVNANSTIHIQTTKTVRIVVQLRMP